MGSTEYFHDLQTADGQPVRPELFARIEKGFFQAEQDWTCYRRNYFSLNCSYTLNPLVSPSSVYLVDAHGSTQHVHDLAMCIAAAVDGREGKVVELVQHTPKRDKGPQEKPQRISLMPRPPPSHAMYGSEPSLPPRALYASPPPMTGPQQEASFERIQFKSATANNGKRRAAQQYYHLIVELLADLGPHAPDRWVKVASRMSAQVVVRGRSPGHYYSEARSNQSQSHGGSGGSSAGGSNYTPTSSRLHGDPSPSTLGSAAAYSNSNGFHTRSQHSHSHSHSLLSNYRTSTAPLHVPLEPMLSSEEAKGIDDPHCYLYYPSPLWEGADGQHTPSSSRQLPSILLESASASARVKSDLPHAKDYSLPSLAFNTQARTCGRWEGHHDSKSFFGPAMVHHEMNAS